MLSEADTLKELKITKELMQMLSITVGLLVARAAAVRLYDHVLQREEGFIITS